ncbi:glycoside hydrolase family 15 protein [Basidiobolus meristosporus CBS 931.73]|uniref:Glycoside hydrolase family 15 protein n=1 Tax=Basidiobolus meristosporus CBS 931.73 TaxID=1314790 RepID=A0A1Y1Z8A1_9FUNG|nr:glycoside hydrolase family 15 protein [Basidiobolus meristosporus CBS 931.73]|eukprot:ORY06481.1 glycoside hydrolase family 15 protein [Basidiobolus meristosporus CBS 931.73]
MFAYKDRSETGYLPIESYGLIGNMRTVALSSTDGAIDYYCYPHFDSPSVFARILDKNKGGHFSITPLNYTSIKQQYLPNSNILTTKFLSDHGVSQITDFMNHPEEIPGHSNVLLPWMVRRIEAIRGTIEVKLECFPAFNYARSKHTTTVHVMQDARSEDHLGPWRVEFASPELTMDLRFTFDCGEHESPFWKYDIEEREGMLGPGVSTTITLSEGQSITFILREVPQDPGLDPHLSNFFVSKLFNGTLSYWRKWIGHSTYNGKWRETVLRSALALKLMVFAPTGAIVAAPTFSLPEHFGGSRNWDYRYTWIRDSAFTIYALLRLGFIEEADAYMGYLERILSNMNPDGSLQIMYTIHGEKDLEEIELHHLEGYRESRPVRIGNGAADHLQLDIYGELLDAIYLYNKNGKPISYDMWLYVTRLVNYVCEAWDQPDMGIWEVRSAKQNFIYSKVMCWVALDRAIRFTEKRSNFPCTDKVKWLTIRDVIYTEIMQKGWNSELEFFAQSYESPTTLDSAILVMPLVFFIAPSDPRLLKTIKAIMKIPEKGGLVENNLVYRYNHMAAEDGVGGEEGSFSLCTFWLVEALTRAGKYDKALLYHAMVIFEQMLGYTNHLSLYSEEINKSGESLGNFPQAFTHIALISAAFNLDRVLGKGR